MSYVISFDSQTGRYRARQAVANYPVGEGDSLYLAVDDLETKLAKPTLRPISTCCCICGRSGVELSNQGPAVGMICEECAKGFAVP